MKIVIAGVVLAALFASPAFARTATVPPEESRITSRGAGRRSGLIAGNFRK